MGKVFKDSIEYPTRIVHTTVAVEETLKGFAPMGEVVVPTRELEFRGSPEDWREPGHRVLLFLTPSRERDEPVYILSNLNCWQTVYLVQGDDIEATITYDITGLNERVAAMTVPELRERIERVTG